MPLCLCGAFAIALLPNLAVAAGIDSLQRQGTAAYAAGNYEQALNFFSQAVATDPEATIALYNQGTALYKLGRFSAATQAFAASAGANNHEKARAKAEYNQGRSLLSEAKSSQDLAQKKELLLAANQAFQQALRDDPRLPAARKGIADFRTEFAKLKQTPPPRQQGQDNHQKQEQKGQGQEQQDLEKQLAEAGQKQQAMANQSKKASSADSQEKASPEELAEMAAQQQSVRQTLEKIKKELTTTQEGQAGGDQSSTDLDTKLEQTIKAQKKAEEALGKGDPGQAQEHQQQAADRLQEMTAAQDPDQKDKAEQAASSAAGKDKAKAGTENAVSPRSHEQVEDHDLESQKTANTVADILDGEKALHEMRRLRLKQQRPASGKDW